MTGIMHLQGLLDLPQLGYSNGHCQSISNSAAVAMASFICLQVDCLCHPTTKYCQLYQSSLVTGWSLNLKQSARGMIYLPMASAKGEGHA